MKHTEEIAKFFETDFPLNREGVNHCPTTRVALKQKLTEQGLLEKSYIPEDGDWLEIN